MYAEQLSRHDCQLASGLTKPNKIEVSYLNLVIGMPMVIGIVMMLLTNILIIHVTKFLHYEHKSTEN